MKGLYSFKMFLCVEISYIFLYVFFFILTGLWLRGTQLSVLYLFLYVLNVKNMNILIKNIRHFSKFVHCVPTVRPQTGVF
jgi:hypothetical protein